MMGASLAIAALILCPRLRCWTRPPRRPLGRRPRLDRRARPRLHGARLRPDGGSRGLNRPSRALVIAYINPVVAVALGVVFPRRAPRRPCALAGLAADPRWILARDRRPAARARCGGPATTAAPVRDRCRPMACALAALGCVLSPSGGRGDPGVDDVPPRHGCAPGSIRTAQSPVAAEHRCGRPPRSTESIYGLAARLRHHGYTSRPRTTPCTRSMRPPGRLSGNATSERRFRLSGRTRRRPAAATSGTRSASQARR